jgi:hypothetical protein
MSAAVTGIAIQAIREPVLLFGRRPARLVILAASARILTLISTLSVDNAKIR